MQLKQVYKLIPTIQHYPWGKIGNSSKVASMLDQVDDTLPYAELWFGAHKRAPSRLEIDGELLELDKFLECSAEKLLGIDVANKFSMELPFLFKILSINKPLSIQAHPNKELAGKLHSKDPINYPDSNHKLELAVAITEVELLHGFKVKSEIQFFLRERQAFRALFDTDVGKILEQEDGLEIIVKELFLTDKDKISSFIADLLEELQTTQNKKPEDQWILKLAVDYPNDVGLFCFYLLNLFSVKPGQAIYTEAGVPHAYLSGDLLECMTNSDNVVRGGLTAKYVDLQTLLTMLNYQQGIHTLEKNFSEFNSPGGEFRLAKFNSGRFDIDTRGLALVFCLSGAAKIYFEEENQAVKAGECYLIPASSSNYSLEVKGEVFLSSVGTATPTNLRI